MIKSLILSIILGAPIVALQAQPQFNPNIYPTGGGSVDTNGIIGYTTNLIGGLYLSTNTIGAQVNALTYGMNPTNDGRTNRIIMQNLVNAGATDIYLPAGLYPWSTAGGSFIVPSNISGVSISGDNCRTIITNTGAGTVFDLQSGDCRVSGITFSEGLTNVPTASAKLWINMNAVGFSKVENCQFLNTKGTAIYAGGDGGINNRSNHCLIANNIFSNVYNGIVTGTNNTFEYGSILNNRMTVVINDAISGGSANCLVEGNNVNGWKDFSGGSGSATSTGLRWMSDNGRGHSKFIGNIFNHHKYDCVLSNLTTTTDFIGNDFSGGQSNVIVNCTDMTFVANRFEPYNGTIMSGCSRMSFGYNHFFTNLFGFSGCAYSGGPNFYTDGSAYTFDCQSASTININVGGGILFSSGQGPTNFFATNIIIDFPSTSVGAIATSVVNIPGVGLNDSIIVTPPSNCIPIIGTFSGISYTNNIVVKFIPTAVTQDPPSGVFNIIDINAR